MTRGSGTSEAPSVARLIRAVARISPHHRGKRRALATLHRRLTRSKTWPDAVVTTMRDGRLMAVDLNVLGQALWYWIGEAEPAHRTERLLRICLRPGDVCIDAGANVGFITTAMARTVGPHGHVYSFEPVRQAFEALGRNVQLNGLRSVTLVNAAVGDSDDAVTLYVDPRRLETASVRMPQTPPLANALLEEECACVTLDDYVQAASVPRVRLLKLDVEGCELAALNGARRLLSEHRPLVWVELHVASAARLQYHPSEIVSLLQQDFGYDAYHMGAFGLVRMKHVGFRRQIRYVLMAPPGGLVRAR